MAFNYPGPYEVRIYYSTTNRMHVQKLNCAVTNNPAIGDAFSTILVQPHSGAPIALSTGVDAYILLVKALYAAADATFIRAELWHYTPGTFDSYYISTYVLGVAGTAAAATFPSGQVVLTFRTVEGGIMRLSLMETVSLSGVTQYAPYGAGSVKNLTDYIIGSTGWILARDTSFPVANYAFHPGGNEALFKKIYRP